MLEVQDRDIVVPGQLIGDGLKHDTTCFTENGKVYSLVRGLARVSDNRVEVIPLSGPYMPKVGDVVVGRVTEDFGGIYLVDIDSAYYCIIREKPDRNKVRTSNYAIGDIISGKVFQVDEVHESDLDGIFKLTGGLIIKVDPKRIPRVIGKNRSMVNTIREKTGCSLVVGQNGLVWVKGEKAELAITAIKKVEAEAHTSGLTDRITEMLNNELSSKEGVI
jgi:exosome complex component RRP4